MSSLFDCPWDLSSKRLLPEPSRSLSNISSRKSHLLNIVCKLLISPRVEDVNSTESYTIENEELWMELLLRSERELRAKLVGFSFSTILHLRPHTGTDLQQEHVWDPAGIKQMLKWASLEHDQVCSQAPTWFCGKRFLLHGYSYNGRCEEGNILSHDGKCGGGGVMVRRGPSMNAWNQDGLGLNQLGASSAIDLVLYGPAEEKEKGPSIQ
ncbi:hypothetical protein AKJ16_DCAP07992, partial [Drosera capensis]